MKLRIVRMCGGRIRLGGWQITNGQRSRVRVRDLLTVRRVPGWGLVWDGVGLALVWGED
ncbi:hypothetical protein [Micromonospora sp. KC213]|uniref:hypothetical protein n=1 Tax=Micromonospora sp. KC213 TaxID=2530378 RepID=UPI001404B73F|nr:hypothetical protein [Micromonospora sp. KC213]